MTEPGDIQLPLTGNYLRETHFVLRHRCWRDYIPWFAKRHLLRVIKEAGLLP